MRKFSFLSLIITTILYSNVCQASVNPCDVKLGSHKAVTPILKTDRPDWMPHHQAIVERVKQGNVDLLMIGDSITHGWEGYGKQVWNKYYAQRNAVNLGIGGDATQHVLWRLQNGEIENINPKLAVLMIGTNNSGDPNTSAEQIAEGIKAIVCLLRTKLPETKVLVLAIFPRGSVEQRRDKSKLSEGTLNPQWIKNNKTNKIISKFADNKTVFYLDINKKFLNKKGVIPREIMPDLIHLREKGYQIWVEAMEPTIIKLMGEKKK